MKGTSFLRNAPTSRILLLTLIAFLTISAGTTAQTATPETSAPAAPTESEQIQRRLARARSLAAVGRLAAAATELESLRTSTTEESVRDVSKVLLMWIYVEMPDYPRANALLEETFKERGTAQNKEAATHAFYALAGQAINGVRAHLDRYRTFGLNVADAELPQEALQDVEQLRILLERLVEHARGLRAEEEQKTGGTSRGLDSTGLLEDAASVRVRLSRNPTERARWQSEVSEARQRLVASETRIASISSVSLSRPQLTAPGAQTQKPDSSSPAPANAASKAGDATAPASSATAPVSSAPKTGTTTSSDGPNSAPMVIGSLHILTRQKSSPSYPAIARAAKIQGPVTVRLLLNEKGDVESILGVEGPMQLHNAAAEAARRWKFHPTVVNGQPVRVTGYITFNFSL